MALAEEGSRELCGGERGEREHRESKGKDEGHMMSRGVQVGWDEYRPA